MKKNLHFKQLQLNYIKQTPKTKKKHMKLVIVSIGVDAVAKINDEVYVLSIIKIYCYFLFVLLLILQWIFACLLRAATKKTPKVCANFFYQPFGCTKAKMYKLRGCILAI